MDSQKNQITDKLKKATNVLVTVSTNPSIDQLSAAIGLTLLLNKLGKHATAVFSGQTPSIIEFLQPEKTFEKTTDSLRDFIIALDKSKADKLRYKVEDQMVKIFITPYRTSITDKDLEFSQGDFNVDVVMALGVTDPKELDQAIVSHGRILHDATVVSVNTVEGASLGTINWVQKGVSSLSEMLLDVGLTLKADALDGQMATAFLTGIVAETDRFSNEKTTSTAMQLSAKLIAAGANQQLIASQLEPPEAMPAATPEADAELPEVAPASTPAPAPAAQMVETKKPDDGALEVDHGEKKPLIDINNLPESEESEEERLEQIDIDKEGKLKRSKDIEAEREKATKDESTQSTGGSRLITQPPTTGLGGTLTANSKPEALDPSTDPLGASAPHGPILSHRPASVDGNSAASTTAADGVSPTAIVPPSPIFTPTSPPPAATPPEESPNTLSDLEKVVGSAHVAQAQNSTQSPVPPPAEHLDSARDAVQQAVSGTPPQRLEPIQSLNAQPVDLTPPTTVPAPSFGASPAPVFPMANDSGLPTGLIPPKPGLPPDDTAASVSDPTAPPPVPPPMMPPPMPPAGPLPPNQP